jgi:hypothetical protein
VSRFLVLDSGPLGLITHPQRNSEVIAITEWLSRCVLGGHRVIVPAIIYYELRRELLRAGKTFSVGRLESFVTSTPGRYLPLPTKRSVWRQNFGQRHASKGGPLPMRRISMLT